jgi:redox-sensitive bicupin YhaK (pirin superfamily)
MACAAAFALEIRVEKALETFNIEAGFCAGRGAVGLLGASGAAAAAGGIRPAKYLLQRIFSSRIQSSARQRRSTMSLRSVKQMLTTKPTVEGAGVRLQRAFGFGKTAEFDPFLLLDDFRSDNPADYLAGFPWHPHRGIETITYVLAGEVAHGDSLGNKGRMTAGDVQWMTAGSGILHQEMPSGDAAGRMHGFQLWANLPASLKMTSPRYQDIPAAAIPEVTEDDGAKARVICGEFWGKKGPVEGVAADPRYVDISIPPGKTKRIKVETTRNAFAYVFAGSGAFRDASAPQAVLTESAVDPNATPVYDAKNHSLVLFDRGDEIVVQAGPEGIRFLLVSGKPLEEPVAWYGPIVMNTDAELRQAVSELQNGTFIRHK